MIIGHQKQWQFLNKDSSLNRLSHAYLFSGPEKLGKKTLALAWASSRFGKDLSQGSHPDLVFIEPEEGKKEIKISQVKDLIWQLSTKPYSASFKTAIIDQAHLMNQESQSCLLKTLEEPKGNAVLFLISQSPEALLPTIISRVQTLKFYPLNNEEMRGALKGKEITGDLFEKVIDFSMGRPGMALDLIADPKKLDLFQKIVKEAGRASDSDLAWRFQYVKNLSQSPSALRETLAVWLIYFRAALLNKIKGGKSLPGYSLSKLKNILKGIQTTESLLSNTNVNPRLALENLILEF